MYDSCLLVKCGAIKTFFKCCKAIPEEDRINRTPKLLLEFMQSNTYEIQKTLAEICGETLQNLSDLLYDY
jgi:hypothetical protein